MFSTENLFLLSLSKSLYLLNDRCTETVVTGTKEKIFSEFMHLMMLKSKKYLKFGFLLSIVSNLFLDQYYMKLHSKHFSRFSFDLLLIKIQILSSK